MPPIGKPVGRKDCFMLSFILLVIAIILFFQLRQLKKKIKSIDDYSALKHEEADNYFTSKCIEADNYSASIRTEADDYLASQQTRADNYYSKKTSDVEELNQKISKLNDQKLVLQNELDSLSLNILVDTVNIDAYEDLKSDEIKNQLALLRLRQDELIKNGSALNVTNSSSQKRVIDSQKKQILRCFNAECVNIIESVTVKNIDASRSKIQRSYDALNKMFVVDGVQITQEFLATKFDELSLVYAYMVKEEEEREQRKAIKEQIAEEEKVRREIEREKQKIEKEEAQFNNEVNKLMAYMQKATDDIERQVYVNKISDLQEKIKKLEADKENILEREQNTRAGFVYIISNIGSFGKNVFKIGMTRRLEPMDRIAELSSASVPFPFDVHALIFSEDAPGLENILHQYFDKNRVNRINPRKEFFRVNLDEIKETVLKNHNATVKFVDIPEAMEYRETLKLNEICV